MLVEMAGPMGTCSDVVQTTALLPDLSMVILPLAVGHSSSYWSTCHPLENELRPST